jgi:hypothetical protein
MEIRLIAFRGTGGFRDPRYQNEPALIKAGHVGLQLEGDATIYGFHPTQEAAEAAGGEDQLTNLLKQHIAQPGNVQDDTAIFERAHALAQQGERTEVIYLTYTVSDAEFQNIHAQLLEWYNNQQVFQYNFPAFDGKFADDEYNCAMFPGLLGLTLPSESGNLVDYLDDMREKGAEEWQPKS